MKKLIILTLFLSSFIFLFGCKDSNSDIVSIQSVYLQKDLSSSYLDYDGLSYESEKEEHLFIVVNLNNFDNITSILSVEINGSIYDVGEPLPENVFHLYTSEEIFYDESNGKIYVPYQTSSQSFLFSIVVDSITYSDGLNVINVYPNEDIKNSVSVFTKKDEPLFMVLDSACGFLQYTSSTGVISIPEILNADVANIEGVIVNDDETVLQITKDNLVYLIGDEFPDFVKVKIVYNNGLSTEVSQTTYYSRIIISSYEELISFPRDLGKSIFVKEDITIPNDGSYSPFIDNGTYNGFNLYGEYGFDVTITNDSDEGLVLIDLSEGANSITNVYSIDFVGDFIIKSDTVNLMDLKFLNNLSVEHSNEEESSFLEVIVLGTQSIRYSAK